MARRRAAIAFEDLEEALAEMAPLHLAEAWDRVGTLVASGRRQIRRVLLAIDLTPAVLEETRERRADGVIAYHPPIFEPLERLADRSPRERTIRSVVRDGLFIYSPHTALDAAPQGVNDWLAEGCGRGRVAPLAPSLRHRPSEAVKIVTFVPALQADRLRGAMASAGAGRIGDYTECSFSIPGEGTFLAGADTRPTLGRRGQLERVAEVRFEIVCGRDALNAAIDALRTAHPYEEPPIEIHPLEAPPLRDAGSGRVVECAQPVALRTLCERLKRHLGVRHLQVAAPDEDAIVRRVGLCAGSGGSLLAAVFAAQCDAFVTGELSHHRVLECLGHGCAVVLAGHTNTERPYLPVFAERLHDRFPGVEFLVSEADRDPLALV